MARQNLSGGGGGSGKTAAQVAADAAYASAANAVKTGGKATQAEINALKNAATAKNKATPPAATPTFDAAASAKQRMSAVDEANAAITEANSAISDINKITGQSGAPLNNVPGGTPPAVTRTMAMDTFRETLSGLFAPGEMNQPWVSALYNVMSKYYNSGSTIVDSMNLSLKDAENNPELAPFTKRFAPIYALRKRQQNGEAVSVPTIAQYIDSEIAFGTILNETGLGSLATQEFIGSVLTTKSVLGATNLINDIFTRIDNAPSALKSDLTSIMGLGVSRTDIAKALLTGKAGADELDKKVKQLTVYSAAKSQGVGIGLDTATDLANMGQGYGESLENFQTVKQLERGQALGRMSGRDYTQNDAIQSTFYKNASAAEKERIISEEEQNRFKAKSGRLQSQNRSANGLI